MMKSVLFALLSLVAITLSSITVADEYDDALYQLNRGEFHAAQKLLEPLVAEGYSPAQYQLAQIYLHGYGIPKDTTKYLALIKLAAAQNYPDAVFELANLYSDGKLVEKDLKQAFKLTEQAARKGLASAQFNLGVMYYNGQGTQVNFREAARWYQKAADQNYALAQFNLALLYFEGKGVKRSNEMSYIWNSIAALSGYPEAAKSRDMDERKLTLEQLKVAQQKAQELYNKIQTQQELRARMARQESFY